MFVCGLYEGNWNKVTLLREGVQDRVLLSNVKIWLYMYVKDGIPEIPRYHGLRSTVLTCMVNNNLLECFLVNSSHRSPMEKRIYSLLWKSAEGSCSFK